MNKKIKKIIYIFGKRSNSAQGEIDKIPDESSTSKKTGSDWADLKKLRRNFCYVDKLLM